MKKLIVANLKMNTTPSEFKTYAMTIATKAKGSKNNIVVCPPFTHLAVAKEILTSSKVSYGAQNMSAEEEGSFTGEVSAKMVKDLGAEYVILGHSDVRNKFKETDKLINRKIKTALANGIKVILCVGESLQTRESKQTQNFVRKQLDDDLKGIYENELEGVIIAYEPVWAISTNKTSSSKGITNKDISKMVEVIRKEIEAQFSAKAAKKITVLYGGSVGLNNYKKILSNESIDGALIGAASLDVDAFSVIARENY